MVSSSSEDVTPMRWQPKRIPRNNMRRNGGEFGEKSFIYFGFQKTFHTQMFSALSSRLFVPLFFVLVWMFIYVPFIRFCGVTDTHKGNGNEYNGCVCVRYNSLFISLPLFIKQPRHGMTIFCVLQRTWNAKANFLRILTLPYTFCSKYLWQS